MILVTGATGLVGSHLLFDLSKKGNKIRALKRKASDLNCVKKVFESDISLFENIEWHECDVLDLFSLNEAFTSIEKVYHCAAMISFKPADRAKIYDVNVNGTANIVNLCLEKSIKKLCHVSSVAALNKSDGEEMISETSSWKFSKSRSAYAVSKHCAEREVWRGMAEGLHAIIVNPAIIIGAGKDRGSTAMFSQVLKGLKYYTMGCSGFIDVRDVVQAMYLLMESPAHSERFILNSENLTYRQVFDWIAEGFGKRKPYIHANALLREAAWRLEHLKSLVFNTTPLITRETAMTGSRKNYFSNEKIKKFTSINFIPVKQSVQYVCAALSEQNKSEIIL